MSAPPTYTIQLERVFHGPLDLLLHLVREQEVEIHEVEISRVIAGYLEYLKAMRDLDIEVAGDFLVMAATLMSIKSRSLLPRESVDLEEGLDPKDELIQRLVEYRRFREVSDRLGERYEIRALQHERGADLEPERDDGPQLDLGEVSAWDLLAQFSRLMRETLANRPHQVVADHRPLRFYVREMARKLRAASGRTLVDLVLAIDGEPTRESLIGSFCALLELAKLGLVRLEQPADRASITVHLREEHVGDAEEVIDASVFDDERAPEPETPAPAASEATVQATAESADA